MQVKGKVKINNKWIDNQIDKSQFDFESRGNIAFGSIQWTDVKKGKNGAKDEFTTTTKRFATFDANVISFLENALGQQIEIEGKLVGSSYVDKEGKKKIQERIVIDKASLAEKKIDKHSAAKGDAYAPQNFMNDNDDEVIF